jgi:hypothetical protein
VAGLIGYALVTCAGIAGWFHLIDISPSGIGGVLVFPVALLDIILLLFWLFSKGFRTPQTNELLKVEVDSMSS